MLTTLAVMPSLHLDQILYILLIVTPILLPILYPQRIQVGKALVLPFMMVVIQMRQINHIFIFMVAGHGNVPIKVFKLPHLA